MTADRFARVNWHGVPFTAKVIKQFADGDWEMQALEHGTRTVPGTIIRVREREIESMDAPAPSASATIAAIQALMDEERKSLPTVPELLAQAIPQAAPKAADLEVLTLAPSEYTPHPLKPPPTQEHTDMTLAAASKLAALADLAKATDDEIGTKADGAMTRLAAARGKAEGGIDKVNSITNSIEKTVAAIDDFANQISNSPLGK